MNNPYLHKTHIVHNEADCPCEPKHAPCAMDYCLKANNFSKCPANTDVCNNDCPACAFEFALAARDKWWIERMNPFVGLLIGCIMSGEKLPDAYEQWAELKREVGQ